MNNKHLLCAGIIAGQFLLAGSLARANLINIAASSSPGALIPDNDLNGLVDTIQLSAPFTSIADVEVTLDISGPYAYNGDYYAYLTHGTGFAVLLNRVGSSALNPYGSPDNGIDVTFSDSASADIHSENAGGGTATGTWQPDGRNVSPQTALDTDPRTAFLSSFDGQNPNGSWTLFVADVSPGGLGYLTSWSVDVSGESVSVPDAATTAGLLAWSVLLLGFWQARTGRFSGPSW